jgi:hypothetical protein
MRFVLRLFLLSTLIVSFLLETVGSAISFHKCIQPIIVECSSVASESETCCCDDNENVSETIIQGHSSESSSANLENDGFECCKEINSYFNVPVYQVAQIFVPSSKAIDLHSEIGFLKVADFPVLISKFVFQSNLCKFEAPPNEHLAVFCVFQI